MSRPVFAFLIYLLLLVTSAAAQSPFSDQPSNTWVKRSPLPNGPPSPRLGYEGTIGYDPRSGLLIHWAGHNQGGGGEQHAETWTYDPRTAQWSLKLPNTAPPGVCCGQQNVFDVAGGRFVRFAAFSGSHGWQWQREIYLNNSSVWTYDLPSNTWRDMRPAPEPRVGPLRCAAWDSDYEVIVVFGGEGIQEGTVVCDPYTNTWTKMNTPDQPAFRGGGGMAYDAARKLHVLFGSQFTDDPHTWAYDLRANRWRDLKPTTQPPTDRNDAVLTYDPSNQVVLALVKVTEGKEEKAKHRLETWVFDVGKNTWTKKNPSTEPDPSGNRARLLTFLPEHGVALLENRTHPPHGPAEQQVWTYRYAALREETPRPPTELRAVTTANGATLNWKPSPSAGVAKYVILRGTGAQPWLADYQEVATVDGATTSFQDTGLKSGTVYYYAVKAVSADGKTSADSSKARTQPRVITDAVVSVLSAKEVELTWQPSEALDVVGYHVDIANVEVWSEDQLPRLKKRTPPLVEPSVGSLRRVGEFTRLTATPVKEPRFTHAASLARLPVPQGKPFWERNIAKDNLDPDGAPYGHLVYAYRIRAVNALGVESGPSPFFLTIPSAPQHVFSREQGPKCDLKWAKNPEKGLKGYRVYRMDGRFDSASISRLTAEPVTAETFTDEEAGKPTRRYYVVAVDALGQEGFPSSPVWFNREWAQFYKPFVGEWHQ